MKVTYNATTGKLTMTLSATATRQLLSQSAAVEAMRDMIRATIALTELKE